MPMVGIGSNSCSFKLTEQGMMDKHASDNLWLPYRKELRST
jgi:hypothetical protein